MIMAIAMETIAIPYCVNYICYGYRDQYVYCFSMVAMATEILGALMSILFLWVVTGVLCYMAVERVIDRTFEVNATIMLITAACGVAFNLL
ncbi:hypothetical protein DPMN_072443 [Dreissena polymorpha]|uniref:Uncharacterized protein n=1 Tax=Dreissena polymorpha TaxID=45954 RepID=A0A9D3Z8P7_DREPO|nr:hypothetical protein DPMN_072443 [Dreissena polymorpha]